METRANHVLIGLFTILGVLGALGFFLWLAKVEVDRQYAYYDILFDSVSGLGNAGAVRYNGLPVGQVISLGLDDADPGKVRVRVEIAADTPITTETVATLEFQGVTGVSYVALTGGRPGAPRLEPPPGGGHPVIPSARSAVQSIFEGAPELLDKAIALLEDLREVTNDENRAAIAGILANLDRASGELETVLRDFSALSSDLSGAAREIVEFSGTLDALAATADETLRTATDGIRRAETVMTDASAALGSAQQTFDSANALISDDLPKLIASVDQTAVTIGTVAQDLGAQAGSVAGKVETLADTATARLAEAQATIAKLDAAIGQADTTLKSVDTLSRDLGALVTGDGAALVQEARAAVANANTAIASVSRVVDQDVPVIVADIRAATAEVNRLVTTLGPGIETAVGRLDAITAGADRTLSIAAETFEHANTTLAAIEATMTTADATLASATRTFDGVNTLIEEDAGAIIADIRRTAAALEQSVGQASADLPLITADIRALLGRTQGLVGNIDAIVAENRDDIDAFAQVGLSEFVRFTQEARKLVQNLERLTARIERDPARFLLGTQTPEFRR